jgi:hypothetical protein
MVAKRKPRNYAATEATLINIRALKKRVVDIERHVKSIARRLAKLER